MKNFKEERIGMKIFAYKCDISETGWKLIELRNKPVEIYYFMRLVI